MFGGKPKMPHGLGAKVREVVRCRRKINFVWVELLGSAGNREEAAGY
jgi:hypothetical protein